MVDFKKLWDKFNKSRDKRWKKIWAKLTELWETKLKDDVKAIIDDVLLELWTTYKDALLQIVLDIATGAIARDKGESKYSAFVKALKNMLDTNKDGKLKFNDLPESMIELLHALSVRYYKGLGGTDGERSKVLSEILDGNTPGS